MASWGRAQRLLLVIAAIGTTAGCATNQKTEADLQNAKDAQRVTVHTDLAYLDEYRLLLDEGKKCFARYDPVGVIGWGWDIDVDGQIYGDQYGEITVHLVNPAADFVSLSATVRPSGAASSVEIVSRSGHDLRQWANLVSGKACEKGGIFRGDAGT